MKAWVLVLIIIVLVGGILIFMNKKEPAGESGSSTATLITSLGEIEVEVFVAGAPLAAGNFLKLAREGYYDGTLFHRVIPDFMIQGGDPLTKQEPENWQIHGTGGPGYTFADEDSGVPLTRGVLAMANAGPNTNGSQFFIITAPSTPWLDGHHTAFGRVTRGLDVVDAIAQVPRDDRDHPLEDVTLEKVVIK